MPWIWRHQGSIHKGLLPKDQSSPNYTHTVHGQVQHQYLQSGSGMAWHGHVGLPGRQAYVAEAGDGLCALASLQGEGGKLEEGSLIFQ